MSGIAFAPCFTNATSNQFWKRVATNLFDVILSFLQAFQLLVSGFAMDQEISTRKSQFRLSSLLSLVVCISIFCRSAVWVFQSDRFGPPSGMSILISPTMAIVGVFAMPSICLALMLLMLILIFEGKPRSFSAILFFGFAILAVALDRGYSDYSLRILTAMMLSSIVMLVETLLRDLPKPQLAAAVLSICVSLGYYIFLTSMVALEAF